MTTYTEYMVVDGHDNAATLATITPQPASPGGIRYPEIRFGGDGSASYHGDAYIDLVWNSLERTEYNAIMTAFGLSQTVAYNAVTVSVRNNDDSFGAYNGEAVRQQGAKRARPFWKDLVIRVSGLKAIT